ACLRCRSALLGPQHLLWQQLNPRDAYFAPARRVSLREAVGEASAEVVAPYAPGVPILVPGEEVPAETREYLTRLRRAGARLQGGSDPTGETLLVVAGSPASSPPWASGEL